jgi:uncharacterized membrane protein YfcA
LELSSPQVKRSQSSILWWVYPVALLLLVSAWVCLMHAGGRWDLFREGWPAAVTMVAGSFVAGSTPAGGGAVAFPVLTKGLSIESEVARSFGLMIQSIGMSMASLFIVSRGIPVAWRAIRLGLAGGIPGLVVGLLFLPAPEPYPRLLFTVVMAVFGVALVVSHWGIRWSPCPHTARLTGEQGGSWHLVALGLAGGYVSSQVGSGIDLLLFMGLTLAFGLHERHAVPTTVIAMAVLSVVGTAVLILSGDPTVGQALPYWWVSVPVVACGAPLGAWVVARAPRHAVIVSLLGLIFLEIVSTTLIVGWSASTLGLGFGVGLGAAVYFAWMLHRRHATLGKRAL